MRGDAIGLGIGHVDRSVADVNATWPAELFPFGNVPSFLVKDLDAIVSPVGDKESSRSVHSKIVRSSELSRSLFEFAKGLYELTVFGKFRNSRDGVRRRFRVLIVALSNEQLSAGRYHHTCRLSQCVWRVSADSRLPDCEQHFAIGIKFDDNLALAFFPGEFGELSLIGRSQINHPDIAVLILVNLVGKNEHARAKTFDEVSGSIKFQDWLQR